VRSSLAELRRIACSRTSTLSFLNIAPATVGHALVIPRRHSDGLWELDDAEHAQVARACGGARRSHTVAWALSRLDAAHDAPVGDESGLGDPADTTVGSSISTRHPRRCTGRGLHGLARQPLIEDPDRAAPAGAPCQPARRDDSRGWRA